ncbi:hypothetical protein L3Q82_009986 [Scortum barcoo]|uniref:Uncharacterized protein n=1 Tax=Scortum barcoo TaxID=214431 RepID=A0ACB8WE20_9TELE|nr:hypothetical protein L3Q82_009986 [Scortum barcoo]
MMEASGAPADVLLQRPWLPVSISGCQLLTKSWFGETAYHILLTDMHCVWEERMDSAAIQERAQELNRRLRAPVKAFFSHLCEVVQPCLCGDDGRPDNEVQISLTRQDGNVSVKLKSELAGLPFYWEFHCTPAPVTVVCAQLVRPLLAMSHLLQRQVEQLGGLLLRKDAEIQDYRENGATLSRERLQTDVFEEQTYRQDFMAKALPLLCPGQQDALVFDSDLQHLYAAVVAHGNRRSQKRKLSEEDRPPAEEADLTSSLGSAEAGEDGEQNGKVDAPETKKVDTPAVRQLKAPGGPRGPSLTSSDGGYDISGLSGLSGRVLGVCGPAPQGRIENKLERQKPLRGHPLTAVPSRLRLRVCLQRFFSQLRHGGAALNLPAKINSPRLFMPLPPRALGAGGCRRLTGQVHVFPARLQWRTGHFYAPGNGHF